ncbi:hypothetical protein PTKIN_Ptkin01aG0345800 [Pterospermum kingtungense]
MASSSEVSRFTVTFIFGVLLLLSFDQHVSVLATRPLHELLLPSFNENLIVESLQKGTPVPPSTGNPCTGIPGHGHGRCTLTEMNVAGGRRGGANAPPPPFPDVLDVDFAAA